MHDPKVLTPNVAGLRRSPPCLVVLGDDYCIVGAESRLDHFWEALEASQSNRLSPRIEREIRRVTTGPDGSGTREEHRQETFSMEPDIFVRVVPLRGPAGSCIAVTLERLRKRQPIEDARQRFRLTVRETEVLKLLLDGCSARDIARTLYISVSTVREYFKHLAAKTQASSRTEMIARVLQWDPGEDE